MCPYQNSSNPPCDMIECPSSEPRYRKFSCKVCKKVNFIDMEADSSPNSAIAVFLGVVLIFVGVLLTNQPENVPSIAPQSKSFTK